jgi:hypothetical protein
VQGPDSNPTTVKTTKTKTKKTGRMDKQNVVYPSAGMFFSPNRE